MDYSIEVERDVVLDRKKLPTCYQVVVEETIANYGIFNGMYRGVVPGKGENITLKRDDLNTTFFVVDSLDQRVRGFLIPAIRVIPLPQS